MFDPSLYNIIDLSLPYDEKISGYDFEIAKTLSIDGWNARTLHIYSHAGTHMDAPLHFGINNGSIDSFAPHQLVGKAWVVSIDILEDKQLLTVEDLGMVRHKFNKGDSLILRTGWDQYLGLPKYRNELPRVSKKLAEWCVEHKVKMLGVEPPSVADVNNLPEVTMIHEILLGGNVIIIEGLTNLDKIEKEEVILTALPLKIKGGDGSPARVIVFEDKKIEL